MKSTGWGIIVSSSLRAGTMAQGITTAMTLIKKASGWRVTGTTTSSIATSALNKAWATIKAIQKMKASKTIIVRQTVEEAWAHTPPRIHHAITIPPLTYSIWRSHANSNDSTPQGYAYLHEPEEVNLRSFLTRWETDCQSTMQWENKKCWQPWFWK